MNRSEANRIVWDAMEGKAPSKLSEALGILKISAEDFERFCLAALGATSPRRDAVASTDRAALSVHGLDSDPPSESQ